MEDMNGGMRLLLDILAQGEEQMRRLGAHLDESEPTPVDTCKHLAQQVQCAFGQAISMVKAMEANAGAGSRGTDHTTSGSPRSADESSGRTSKDVQESPDKKRKGPRWTNQVRLPAANLEATPDDGYSWRKYGQKDILGAKFPRAYYRCTHRNARGCQATKQVQRSDMDPCVFNITYQGLHTCQHKPRQSLAAAAAAPGNDQPNDHNQQLLLSFTNDLNVETEGVLFHDHEQEPTPTSCFSFPSTSLHGPRPETAAIFSPSTIESNLGGSFSPAFISPATSGSNYFSMSQCQVGSHAGGGVALHGSESEFAEVISAATASAMDSPMASFDYALYPTEFDPHLPFGRSFQSF